MSDGPKDHAVLQVWAGDPFIPVVASFAEKMALALGLRQAEAFGLTLAAEEVFSHLCRVVLPAGGWVEVRCAGGGYFVQTEFMFPATDINMRAFNITATVSLADDAQIEEMGLLLASRSVDRFQVSREDGRGLKLILVKERTYPQRTDEEPPPAVEALPQFSVRPPDAGELKLFADLVSVHYRDGIVADIFKSPGRLVDMVGCGEYRALVAVGPAGEIGGGTLWCGTGTRAVEWFGPYLFNQGPDSPIGSALLDSCIGAIARTPAVVLMNRFSTPEFPREEFEYLGHVTHSAADGTTSRREAWARLMQEDLGSAVWVHPQLHDFVRKEYARLILPREIRLAEDQGERHAPHSVLLAAFDRLQGNVTLQPVWWGDDFVRNLLQHLDLFCRENIRNVFFSLDLGHAWEVNFVPGLLDNGFKPCLILPYAGAGDVIVFQCDGATA